MQRLPAKIVAYVFLLIVSAPVLLSLNFLIQEILIEQEAEKKMEAGVFQSVRIKKANLHWVKMGKEVLLDGRLLDVKHFETGEDEIVTLTGIFDVEETKLYAELKEYAEHTGNDNAAGNFVFKFQFSPLYSNCSKISFEPGWLSISNRYHSFVSCLPVAPSIPFIHPPC